MEPTAALLLILGACASATGQDATPNPAADAKQIVQQVVDTDLAAGAADKTLWLYHEVDQKPKLRVNQWVAETVTTDVPRILEENGQKLSEAEQKRRLDAFLRDRGAQTHERKKQQEDLKQTAELLKLLPVAFVWSVKGSEGGETTLHFKPDPNFHPPTAQARILAAVEGDLVVNSARHRIIGLKGELVHDVKFGGGILGEIKSGGTFAIERREVIPGEWLITGTHVHFTGHMLLFKSVSEEEDDEKANFKQLPADITLDRAGSTLFSSGDLATR